MTAEVSPSADAMLTQMRSVLRQHLPQQAGELFAEILTTNDELQAQAVKYENEIKALRSRLDERENTHAENINDLQEHHREKIALHEKTIADQTAEMEKLIDKIEELKEWEARSERVKDAEREVATAILKVKLEEADKRATEIRELSEMFAGGRPKS